MTSLNSLVESYVVGDAGSRDRWMAALSWAALHRGEDRSAIQSLAAEFVRRARRNAEHAISVLASYDYEFDAVTPVPGPDGQCQRAVAELIDASSAPAQPLIREWYSAFGTIDLRQRDTQRDATEPSPVAQIGCRSAWVTLSPADASLLNPEAEVEAFDPGNLLASSWLPSGKQLLPLGPMTSGGEYYGFALPLDEIDPIVAHDGGDISFSDMVRHFCSVGGLPSLRYTAATWPFVYPSFNPQWEKVRQDLLSGMQEL